MCDSCGCDMPSARRGRSGTLLLGLALAAAASLAASSSFATSMALWANDQPAASQPAASCCGNCIPGVPCCGYCTPAQKQNRAG